MTIAEDSNAVGLDTLAKIIAATASKELAEIDRLNTILAAQQAALKAADERTNTLAKNGTTQENTIKDLHASIASLQRRLENLSASANTGATSTHRPPSVASDVMSVTPDVIAAAAAAVAHIVCNAPLFETSLFTAGAFAVFGAIKHAPIGALSSKTTVRFSASMAALALGFSWIVYTYDDPSRGGYVNNPAYNEATNQVRSMISGKVMDNVEPGTIIQHHFKSPLNISVGQWHEATAAALKVRFSFRMNGLDKTGECTRYWVLSNDKTSDGHALPVTMNQLQDGREFKDTNGCSAWRYASRLSDLDDAKKRTTRILSARAANALEGKPGGEVTFVGAAQGNSYDGVPQNFAIAVFQYRNTTVYGSSINGIPEPSITLVCNKYGSETMPLSPGEALPSSDRIPRQYFNESDGCKPPYTTSRREQRIDPAEQARLNTVNSASNTAVIGLSETPDSNDGRPARFVATKTVQLPDGSDYVVTAIGTRDVVSMQADGKTYRGVCDTITSTGRINTPTGSSEAQSPSTSTYGACNAISKLTAN